MPNERTTVYMNYALENESAEAVLQPGAAGVGGGNLTAGVKTRLSDSTSVYLEERYRSASYMSGLTHSTGVNLVPTQRLTFSASTDIGTLTDMRTGAETKRQAAAFSAGYGQGALQVSSGVEYRTETSSSLIVVREPQHGCSGNWVPAQPSVALVGKFNYSDSQSTLGQFYDGGYTKLSRRFAPCATTGSTRCSCTPMHSSRRRPSHGDGWLPVPTEGNVARTYLRPHAALTVGGSTRVGSAR